MKIYNNFEEFVTRIIFLICNCCFYRIYENDIININYLEINILKQFKTNH